MLPIATRLAFSLLLSSVAFAQITPGNLIVTRSGDGAAALSNASTAAFLDEYTPAGVFVQTIALPTAASGANLPVTYSGTATSEGFLSQSVDGRYLIGVGYGTAPGLASVAGTTAAVANRVVARIALDGTIDSSTALTDAYSASNIRSAVSVDGTQFWTSGNASAANGPGVRFTTFGATTSTQISATLLNVRVLNIFDNQLYASSASGAFQGVSTAGVGLPLASGETITLLPGFPTASGPSAYDFFFADASTLYVADDRTSGAGGIQKWALSGGTWSLQYTLAAATNAGCRGLSGFVENGVATLFATTTNNLMVSVVDTGAGSLFTTLVTGAANTALRGVQYVRRPASLVYTGTNCANNNGTPTVATNGAPVIASPNFAITGASAGPLSFVIFALSATAPLPIGLPIPNAPACAVLWVNPDLLLGGFADGAGNASTPLPIPASSSLGGTVLGAQFVAFDLSLTGFFLPIGTSNALQITIGN